MGHAIFSTRDLEYEFSDKLEFYLLDKIIQYLYGIGSEAHTTLVNMLKECLGVDRLTEALQSPIRNYFCRSAHISGTDLSTTEDMDGRKQA